MTLNDPDNEARHNPRLSAGFKGGQLEVLLRPSRC